LVVVGLPYINLYELDAAADEVTIIAVLYAAQDRDQLSE